MHLMTVRQTYSQEESTQKRYFSVSVIFKRLFHSFITQKQTRSPKHDIQTQIYKNMISEALAVRRTPPLQETDLLLKEEVDGLSQSRWSAGSHGHLQLGVLVLPLLLLQVRLRIISIQLQGGQRSTAVH